MGDLLRSFLGNIWVKTKYAEKTCVSMWGQSSIQKTTGMLQAHLYFNLPRVGQIVNMTILAHFNFSSSKTPFKKNNSKSVWVL